ncbi:sensor histidine kinase [Ureibacillus aquaedulcis]|uniref:histidine kinase n=1 Tax=Ureibacillus aquaedulcis TaxID=3058421 RepID=A0ABT8GSE4_9BACL|nr:ATP-binding protein [Ureibacillus sp. BA0131]MDN4494332.1 ATP-binding protein [Ureibacillus sp. BA0131]
MKHNLLPFLKSFITPSGKDLFSRTQGQLTRIYSGLLILFLMLFIVIVYSILYYSILKSSERELESLADQEAQYIEQYLLENRTRDFRDIQNQEIVFSGVNQVFYYVMNSDGEIIMGNDEDSRLQAVLPPLLKSRITKGNGVFLESLHLEGNQDEKGNKREFHRPESDQDISLMIAGHPITFKGQTIGQLYIGRDFTFASQLFQWVLIILIVLGLIFIGLALFMSQKMSKKAMVPIAKAFTRQKEFAADASHELRTPLAVLQSSLDAMDMTLRDEKDQFTEKLLKNMRQEVKRMTSLVGDLLTLARSDSNTVELRKDTFNLRQMAEDVLESVRPLADEKTISTSLDAPENLMVVADPERLSQLIYILLDNAIKYTPAGGAVKISLSQEECYVYITVNDTGVGIKDKDLNHIFERFYRADKSRSRQMGGHGLGLSIAKWIVETHKGTIEVSSELEKGSTFLVKIPRKME